MISIILIRKAFFLKNVIAPWKSSKKLQLTIFLTALIFTQFELKNLTK